MTLPAIRTTAAGDSLVPALAGHAVAKGHGTGNDFVLLPDPDGALALGPGDVAALCDRHRGLGGDGLLRVVRTEALGAAPATPDDPGHVAAATAAGARWFMDYRNADGSVAEMCGNGIRVFAHYLYTAGLEPRPGAGAAPLAIGTRAGVKYVRPTPALDGGPGTDYAVDMGPWTLPGGDAAAREGRDAEVGATGIAGAWPGLRVDVGNPHTVVALPGDELLAGLDLGRAPVVTPVPEDGTNVEFIVVHGLDGRGEGRLRMRVHERGVGETLSCGTGCCAAALAARSWAGAGAPDAWRVTVPGGEVRVRMLPGADGREHVELTGPAVVVLAGTLA